MSEETLSIVAAGSVYGHLTARERFFVPATAGVCVPSESSVDPYGGDDLSLLPLIQEVAALRAAVLANQVEQSLPWDGSIKTYPAGDTILPYHQD